MTRSTLAICLVALVGFAKPVAAQDQASGHPVSLDPKLVQAGKKLFAAKGCNGCHTIGRGDLVAPDLGGLLNRRSEQWVRKWLHDPPRMLETDDSAKALMKRFNGMRMPELDLNDKMIDALISYIAEQTEATRRSPSGSQ